ncbi:four helix bundle protein [Flagellimonas sp.]|uniref:four helix bundle protein n=1 Tax=Flagellimonas sp. TaxID=2058762 RepID=UPI003B51E800
MKENVVVVKSTELALEIISFCEVLEAKKKFVVGKQLLRSGTSVGANIRESQHAESRAYFIHKLKIAAKELEETKYWLELCEKAPTYPSKSELGPMTKELGLILGKIVSTSKRNSKK